MAQARRGQKRLTPSGLAYTLLAACDCPIKRCSRVSALPGRFGRIVLSYRKLKAQSGNLPQMGKL